MPTTVELSSPTPLRRFTVALQGDAVQYAIGQAVSKLVTDNFYSLPPNAAGYPTTSFWQRAAAATRFDVVPDGVRITVDQTGVRQRLLGGEIHPQSRRWLAVPANAETYGYSPAEFGPLKIAPALAEDPNQTALALVPDYIASSAAHPAPTESVFYWLVNSVVQQPDPKVIPTLDACLAVATDAAIAALK